MIDYHINPDGMIPCTNCGEEIEPFESPVAHFVHSVNGQVICYVQPYEGQVACPQQRGVDLTYDPDTGRAIPSD